MSRGSKSVKQQEPGSVPSTAAAAAIATKRGAGHGRIVSPRHDVQYLDSGQLGQLEQSFYEWWRQARRKDLRRSRGRLLLIFLLIRYTGAKLNEVLMLQPDRDFDWERSVVRFRGRGDAPEALRREVQLSTTLVGTLRDILGDPVFPPIAGEILRLDPGFVRRKFYERAAACGFVKRLGGPGMLRKARAVELMQGNMPLPAVQMMLGHSSPNLTSDEVRFGEE